MDFFTSTRRKVPPSAMNGRTSTMNVRTPTMDVRSSAVAELFLLGLSFLSPRQGEKVVGGRIFLS